jgi:regulation of enolase protein 1 (concanavalin A-like superfamily)
VGPSRTRRRLWDAADAFQFVWQPLSGDGEIVARVAGVQYTKAWTKAGVMIRESLDPGSPHAFMIVSAGKGYAFQRRVVSGGLSDHTPAGTGTAPHWVKLTRSGDLFSAFHSADGVTWTLAGSEIIPMGRAVMAGLAVSSHTSTAASQAVFESVRIR